MPGNDSHLSPDASSLCSSIDKFKEGIDNVVNSVSVVPHDAQKVFDCACNGCTDLNNTNQPLDISKSKLIHSHHSNKGKAI